MTLPNAIAPPFLGTLRAIQDGIDAGVGLCDSILENQNVGEHPTKLKALRDSLLEGHKTIRAQRTTMSNLPGIGSDGGDDISRTALEFYRKSIDTLNSKLRGVTEQRGTHHNHHHRRHHHSHFFFTTNQIPKRVKADFDLLHTEWERIRDGIISVFEELKIRLEAKAAAKIKEEKDAKAAKDRAKLDALALAEKNKLEDIAKKGAQRLLKIAAAELAEKQKWAAKEKKEEEKRENREKTEAKRMKKLQHEEERRLKALTEMEESWMKRKLEERPLEQVKGMVEVMSTMEENMVMKELKELKPPNYPPVPPPPPVQGLTSNTTTYLPIGNANSGVASQLPRKLVGHITLQGISTGYDVVFDLT